MYFMQETTFCFKLKFSVEKNKQSTLARYFIIVSAHSSFANKESSYNIKMENMLPSSVVSPSEKHP